MTKFFKASSLLAFLLAVVSANVNADVIEDLTRASCCPAPSVLCDLKVKNNVWVGGTLNANCINQKCCGEKCPVMLGCEKCLLDTRGTVQIFNFDPVELTYTVVPVRGDLCFSVTSVQPLDVVQLSGSPLGEGYYSAKITFDIVFNKPYKLNPSVFLSTEIPFTNNSLAIAPGYFFSSLLYNPMDVSITKFTVCFFFVGYVLNEMMLVNAIASLLNTPNQTYLSFKAQGSIDCPPIIDA